MTLATWAAAKSDGVMTAEIEAHCRRVVELYREHFLGQGTYLTTDTLQYYTQALRMLGEGVEVAMAFGVAEPGSPPEPKVARFASVDEAEREMAWRVRAAMTSRLSPWW
jgi:hypothetical protein